MKQITVRILALLLAAAMCISLAACGGTATTSSSESSAADTVSEASSESESSEESQPEASPEEVRIAGLKGPTTMGMVRLVAGGYESDKIDLSKYTFTLAGSADEITPKLIQGELDMAAVPANLASVLYNKTEGGIRLLAVNTLGVLYIVDTDGAVASFADLKGKTIYATGKGSTPEYTLRYLLTQNGIDPDNDVTIEWKSEPTEVVALLKESGGIAMLPQPYVTVAQTQIENLSVVLNLTEEWNTVSPDSMLITGVLVARAEFVEQYPQETAAFLEEYAASIAYTNENVEDAAALIEEVGIVKAAVAQKAIPACNITYLAGEEMKQAVSGYLAVLYEQNPAAVGGTLPADDFYYLG